MPAKGKVLVVYSCLAAHRMIKRRIQRERAKEREKREEREKKKERKNRKERERGRERDKEKEKEKERGKKKRKKKKRERKRERGCRICQYVSKHIIAMKATHCNALQHRVLAVELLEQQQLSQMQKQTQCVRV